MENLFLTDTQISELTGYTNRKCQCNWLNRNGVKYLIGADGIPKIMLEHLKQIMGCFNNNKHIDRIDRKRTQPDVEALRRHLGTL